MHLEHAGFWWRNLKERAYLALAQAEVESELHTWNAAILEFSHLYPASVRNPFPQVILSKLCMNFYLIHASYLSQLILFNLISTSDAEYRLCSSPTYIYPHPVTYYIKLCASALCCQILLSFVTSIMQSYSTIQHNMQNYILSQFSSQVFLFSVSTS
jgi:hypothetical protein